MRYVFALSSRSRISVRPIQLSIPAQRLLEFPGVPEAIHITDFLSLLHREARSLEGSARAVIEKTARRLFIISMGDDSISRPDVFHNATFIARLAVVVDQGILLVGCYTVN